MTKIYSSASSYYRVRFMLFVSVFLLLLIGISLIHGKFFYEQASGHHFWLNVFMVNVTLWAMPGLPSACPPGFIIRKILPGSWLWWYNHLCWIGSVDRKPVIGGPFELIWNRATSFLSTGLNTWLILGWFRPYGYSLCFGRGLICLYKEPAKVCM